MKESVFFFTELGTATEGGRGPRKEGQSRTGNEIHVKPEPGPPGRASASRQRIFTQDGGTPGKVTGWRKRVLSEAFSELQHCEYRTSFLPGNRVAYLLEDVAKEGGDQEE